MRGASTDLVACPDAWRQRPGGHTDCWERAYFGPEIGTNNSCVLLSDRAVIPATATCYAGPLATRRCASQQNLRDQHIVAGEASARSST